MAVVSGLRGISLFFLIPNPGHFAASAFSRSPIVKRYPYMCPRCMIDQANENSHPVYQKSILRSNV